MDSHPGTVGVAPWSFACPDWFERMKVGRSLMPDLPLDPVKAEKAVRIFNTLVLPDVPGFPAMEDAAGEWFRDIVRALFGSLSESRDGAPLGVRMVPEIMALVPKKNSKTTNSAGVGIVALLMNERPMAEFLIVGPTQEVADLAFQQASGMIANDPHGFLQQRFHIREHVKTIVDRTNKATLRIKTFDMRVMVGSKPAGVILDELHIMSSFAFASRVLGQIRGGLLPNPEAFLLIITTQSDMPPAGVFRAELMHARAIRDGRAKGRMLPVLYEFPEKMQTADSRPWADPQNWPMVLPNLSRSITLPRLIEDFDDAKEKGDEEIRRWASQHLNVEIGLAMHAARWRGADYWQSSADESLTLDTLIERSEVIAAGIDGGGLDDLAGLALLGRCKLTKDWLLWSRAWAHTDVLDVRKDIVERLRDFERDGDLVICETPTQDVEGIAEIIGRVHEAGKLPEKWAVGLDPLGVAAIIEALAGKGIEGEMLASIGQGFRLSDAVWGMERKLKDGTLWHSGSRLMNWCVGNARAEQRGNAVLITKETAGKAKIDPLIAAFNAFRLMSRNPEPKRKPTYQVFFA